MKTLYSILGLDSAATPEQIEHAFSVCRTRIEGNADKLPASEVHNQLVALKEAYATLADPTARQRYDQRLAMTREEEAAALRSTTVAAEKPSSGLFGTRTIVIVGLFVLAGIYLYNEKAKERERLRIDHEHEIQMKAAETEAERQQHNARVQDAIVETVSANMTAEQRLAQQRQFEAESARREQLELQRQQMEMRQEQQRQYAEAARRRQEQYDAQQRAAADKRYLQQLEREHYGKVITY